MTLASGVSKFTNQTVKTMGGVRTCGRGRGKTVIQTEKLTIVTTITSLREANFDSDK